MFTRCPNCKTTFRITRQALEMAGGQVRCGRCTQVFDARTELFETPPAETDTPREAAPPREAPPDSAAAGAGAASRAASAEVPAPDAAGSAAAAAATDADRAAGIMLLSEDWQVEAPPPRRRALWAAAAALAALALGLQLAHRYRAELAASPAVGEYVTDAYAALGIELVPRFDPNRYRIRDWVATAEQTGDGRQTLLIRAAIENRGPEAMPQPHIFLQLKDRRDAVVASRVLSPDEYLPAERASASLAPGETMTAELEVLDPGPDAYGFELDVCVPRAAGRVRCANDDVFR